MTGTKSISITFLIWLLCCLLPSVECLEDNTLWALVDSDPATTIIFPWFIQCVGVCVFFFLTRFEIPIPYAAVMFVIGTAMGLGSVTWARSADDAQDLDKLSTSILQWSNLSSSVLLLVFLPGLIFRDAIEVNFSLFLRALPQLLIFAFPMVLVGTVLTAVVAYFVLPLGWPLELAATLGAILASTDPVAVGSVLKKAGAPPRIQMHISGESLINDGSAVVFFSIFSQQYLAAALGVGEMVDLKQGFAIFLRMSLGGCLVGVIFAIGLLIMLYELDRRLEPEYNVLQVAIALTFAYLSYYVSEQVFSMSGVIACVVCGVGARAFGRGLITNNQLMDSYLALMEFLLNTLLFSLGGVVWGKVIAVGYNRTIFNEYWLYLLALFVLVMAIRFFQVALFYPIFSRIGLRSNWRESTFFAYAGLRGAVGVALALSLTRSVRETSPGPAGLAQVESLEFFAGGITVLSLLLLGTTASPVLKYLGLVKPLTSRKRALRFFRASAKEFVSEEYEKIRMEPRFSGTSFEVIKGSVPYAPDVAPPFIRPRTLTEQLASESFNHDVEICGERLHTAREQACPNSVMAEVREIFLELLNQAYSKELANSELSEREDNGMNIELLKQSVEMALVDCKKNKPLHDFAYTQNFQLWEDAKAFVIRLYRLMKHGKESQKHCCSYDYQQERVAVLRSLAFIHAHRWAEKKLTKYLDSFALASFPSSDREDPRMEAYFEEAIQKVLNESSEQVYEAQSFLDSLPKSRIKSILSFYVSTILLRKLAKFIEKCAEDGLLTKKEARIELDRVDRSIASARTCVRDYKLLANNDFTLSQPTRSSDDSDPHGSILEV